LWIEALLKHEIVCQTKRFILRSGDRFSVEHGHVLHQHLKSIRYTIFCAYLNQTYIQQMQFVKMCTR